MLVVSSKKQSLQPVYVEQEYSVCFISFDHNEVSTSKNGKYKEKIVSNEANELDYNFFSSNAF